MPANIKRLETGVIQEGEVTGHHHKVAVEDVPQTELYEVTGWQGVGDKYLRVTGDSIAIVHEEHHTVTLPRGLYAVHIAREFDYLAQFARQVRD